MGRVPCMGHGVTAIVPFTRDEVAEMTELRVGDGWASKKCAGLICSPTLGTLFSADRHRAKAGV